MQHLITNRLLGGRVKSADLCRFLQNLGLQSTFPAPRMSKQRCTQHDMAVPLHNLIEEISRITQTVNYSSAKRPSINYLA